MQIEAGRAQACLVVPASSFAIKSTRPTAEPGQTIGAGLTPRSMTTRSARHSASSNNINLPLTINKQDGAFVILRYDVMGYHRVVKLPLGGKETAVFAEGRNMNFNRVSLRVACSTVALACAASAVPAWAQSTQPAGSSQSVPSTADTQQPDVADIIVTAQKRKERILDVPVSVNAVSSDQLDRQRVYNLQDLSRSVPSVGPNLSIRGISTSGATRSAAGAVAILLDGVDLGPLLRHAFGEGGGIVAVLDPVELRRVIGQRAGHGEDGGGRRFHGQPAKGGQGEPPKNRKRQDVANDAHGKPPLCHKG